MASSGFIDYLKSKEPATWALIKQTAETSDLIVVDEGSDSVTASNRLLWTYPGIHQALSTIINAWNENEHQQIDFVGQYLSA
jgi:hypothetical protein